MDLINAAIIARSGSNAGSITGSIGESFDTGSLSTLLQSWATAQSAIGQETNTLLSLIARAVSEDASGQITDFQTIQSYLRAGQISRILSVGDQLRVNRLDSVTATVSGNITAAAVDAETFLTKTRHPETASFTFTYDGSGWSMRDANGTVRPVELAAYGITVTGTPAANDVITVHETASTLLWDVLGIDCDTPADAQRTHALTLGLHNCVGSLQFDAKEALFYFAEGLSAGTYNFTVTEHTWVPEDVGKTFQFTLTEDVPAGGQLTLAGANNVTLANSTANTYSGASSATKIETVTITEGSGGTSLGNVSNAIADGTNSLQRALNGNGNYGESAIRQYLNSTAAAGSVWTARNVWDRAPSWNESTAGFLKGLDKDFLSVIGEVTKKTALNTACESGGYTTSSEKVFLLSRSEVYGCNAVTGGEGAAYPYFSDYSDLESAASNADSNRIKFRNGSERSWWLRSPYDDLATTVYYVYTTGRILNFHASNSYGVAPACCIV